MSASARPRRRPPSPARLALTPRLLRRGALVALGAAAVAWSALALRAELRLEPLETVSGRMLDDQTYSLPQLAALEPRLRSAEADGCPSRLLSQAAMIRAYAAAVARRTADANAAELAARARRALDRSLACDPRQPFLLYLRFWVQSLDALGARTASAGAAPSAAALADLAASYALAPHEGWIARFRQEDALPVYGAAGPGLQAAVRAEFADLLRDDPGRAAMIFRDAGPAAEGTILAFLKDATPEQRQRFAALLDQLNVVADVPGVEYRNGAVYTPPVPRRPRRGAEPVEPSASR